MTNEAESRMVRKGGEESRINLASAGVYAVLIGKRIYQAGTVAELRAKVAPLGWK